MSTSVLCHACGHLTAVPAGFTRRRLRCPACGVLCDVPAPAAKAPAARAAAPTPAAAEPPAEPPAPRAARPEPRAEAAPPRPRRAPPPRPQPRQVATVDDADDGRPYVLLDKEEPPCPQCGRPLEPGAALCSACGFNQATGEKAVRTYQEIDRAWESGISSRWRRRFFLAGQALVLPLGLLGSWHQGTPFAFLGPWLVFTALTAFLLGTYNRVHLARDRRGKVRLTRRWRIGFHALKPETIPLREYEGVVCGLTRDVDFWDWALCVFLLPWGLVPGVLWWYLVIHPDTYYVALSRHHGSPELSLYRGRSEALMHEIADTIRDAARLPRDVIGS